MATKNKSVAKSRELNATIQWVALVGIFVLIVLAVFVFNIGGAGSGGGHTN